MTTALSVSLPFQCALLLVAAVLYSWIIQRLRHRAPLVLEQVDPRGYRGLNASSQWRFTLWLLRGGFRAVDDGPLRWGCRAFLVVFLMFTLGWVVPLFTARG